MPSSIRSILHVDMDAFYASVEQRDRPELRGKPVIVGGTPAGRGVVAAASYEAREFGVHSAMPAARAARLCPHAAFVRPRMNVYADVGHQVREILGRFTPLVEPLSLDEAFLDVTGSHKLHGPAVVIGRKIKRCISEELQLVASVGVAPNKFLAKIASDLEKPDGFTTVEPGNVQMFLDPLPIRRLWGVGRKAEARLSGIGIKTIGQLRQLPEQTLVEIFGEKGGQHLARLCRGEDDRPVVPDHEAISISHETTFSQDLTDRDILRAVLQQLTDQVARRLRRQQAQAATIQLKIRYADFQTHTRSLSLPAATDSTREIWSAIRKLFEERLPDRPLEIRLLGVGVSHLLRGDQRQKLLFEDSERTRERQLDEARDAIARKFGHSGVRPASQLDQPENTRSGPYGQE